MNDLKTNIYLSWRLSAFFKGTREWIVTNYYGEIFVLTSVQNGTV